MDDVLVLWDIDGTLLTAGGVGRDLYDVVFRQLFGQPLTSYAPMAGRTDRAIILETLTQAGVAEPRRYVDPFIAGLGAHARSVGSAVAERGAALPGAAEVLAALAAARYLAGFGALGAGACPSGAGDLVGVGAAAPGGSGGRAVSVAAAPAAGAAGPGLPGGGLPGSGLPAAGLAGGGLPGNGLPGSGLPPTGPPGAGLPGGGLPANGLPGSGLPAAGLPGAEGGGGGGKRGVRSDGGRRVHQTVLTGNIRAVAEVKLTALGLRDGLDLCIGAYGDDHEDRTELVQVARRRAAGVHGRSAAAFAGTATVVVGDTPLDIAAALAAGARAIGVASGSYAAADLTAAGAHAVLPSLADTALVLDAIFD